MIEEIIKISIIIPCRNEEQYIGDCLNSILQNDYPHKFLEVFIVDGLSSDGTQQIIQEFISKYHFIKLLLNEKKTVPCALNIGIKKASGAYVIRLDAHSKIPKNYFSTLVEWSKKLNADNIGAVCITETKNKNKKSNSIISVLSNRFGVGNSHFRIGVSEIREVDHVPFGCYKKSIFEKVGLFDERLIRNQDIELSKRITRNGGHIFLLPDLFCTYYARETFYGIAKNNYGNGFWNILTVYFTRKIGSLSWRHFIPFVFMLSLLVPLFSMIWYPIIGLVTVLILAVYMTLILSISLKINNKRTTFLYILWTFVVLHFSYGFGSLVGFLRIDHLMKFKK